MDFDLSKENIQPLRGGRNVTQLGAALQAQNDGERQRELLQQRGEFENLIKTYKGDDPLGNWYSYICWVEQSYPTRGPEGNLVPLLEHCLKLFETEKGYKNDRRLCKLFIKYIDLQQNPLELYHMMYAQGICRGCADMYRAWAYYYEAAGDFQKAHRVFEYGKHELAQPFQELEDAQRNLVEAAGRHMIYGPNEEDLLEKRQALTSLCTYKSGQVGSIRHPSATGPGMLGTSGTKPNASVSIYEDNSEQLWGAAAPPNSIVTAARRQDIPKENTLKPEQWPTVPVKKRITVQKTTPGFTVHEDSEDVNDRPTGIRVTTTLENYANWIVSLTIPEPRDDRMIPMYPKAKVYSEISTEYSLEELRAARYLAKKNRLHVAPAETSQAVQSILEDVTMSFSIQKEKESPHQSIHNEQNTSFGQRSKNFSFSTSREEQVPEKEDIKLHNSAVLNFDIWSPVPAPTYAKKAATPLFNIYEQSSLQEQMEPKGSAMKTPFNDLNAEDLAETGSRGGMDTAAAAPVDSAKRLPIDDDDSTSTYEKMTDPGDLSCNTQMFVFNLNAMKVSTPQNKPEFVADCDEDALKVVRKQLFTETITAAETQDNKALSTIFEETKSYGHSSSSSSSNATTKSSVFTNHTKPNNMATISEEHNSYLAQNLMANAALRSSLLGDLIANPVPVVPKQSFINEPIVTIPTPTKVTPLNIVPSDPFKPALIEKLLRQVGFPGRHTQGYCILNNIPRILARKETVQIGSDRYLIEKQLGKGTYGTVFRAVDCRTENIVALKYQKPANKWEFYICRELQSRLADHPLRERFMDVKIGYFYDDHSSILISEYMPCGSLLDVANMVKQKSGRPMKESLSIYFCLEMLKVVQAMHEVKIIHADIKPDNFLVKLFPNDQVGLHLIDFGCSIDMTMFPPNTTFTRKVTTEDFVCCEMKDGRPWSYHTDLFCVAATAHVLLFEKYIQMQKSDGHWSITNRLPRYARLDLWNMFFSTLLNQQNGPADSVTLQNMLEDSLNHKFDDYHNEIRYLVNILKNR